MSYTCRDGSNEGSLFESYTFFFELHQKVVLEGCVWTSYANIGILKQKERQ